MDDAAFRKTIAEAGNGDRRALTALYAAYNRMLVRFLRTMVPGRGEQLAHQVWLEVAAALRDFGGDERAFRTSLLAEARRQAARANRPSKANPSEGSRPAAIDLRATWVGEDPITDSALAELLDGLPVGEAEILLLRVVGGLTVEETAAMLGKGPEAVRRSERLALGRIARRLAAQETAPDPQPRRQGMTSRP